MVLARTFRGFAHERPAAFGLLFAPGSELAIDADVLAGSSASMLAVAAELSGPDHALDSARTLTAWAYGFVSMELSGRSASAETSSAPSISASIDSPRPLPRDLHDGRSPTTCGFS